MIGQTLRSYRILARLGSGGMGEVFMAEHLRLGRKVAIKVLPAAAVGNPRAVGRLLSEARAAAALKHPHIVQIYDCDVQDGRPFVAMEYLEGETLAQFLGRRVAVDLSLTGVIGSQIADALAAAHAKGIVHRDLKPANVFLRRDEQTAGFPWVKLLDFGIAKLLYDHDTPGSLRTQSGELVGTPAYMAPEQCRGRGEVYTPADVYALGCILFEMVCGRRPFEQEGLGELISAHLNDPPPDPRLLQPALPEPWRAVILAALSKPPEQRPSAQAMCDLLRSLPAPPSLRIDQHTQALPAPPRRRRRALMVVLLGGATAAALGWGLVGRRLRPAPSGQPRPSAPVPVTAASLDVQVESARDAAAPPVPEVATQPAPPRPPRQRTRRRTSPPPGARPPAPRPAVEPKASPYRALDD
jgi:eukaryotic-like serine/threonine-protein kinase